MPVGQREKTLLQLRGVDQGLRRRQGDSQAYTPREPCPEGLNQNLLQVWGPGEASIFSCQVVSTNILDVLDKNL